MQGEPRQHDNGLRLLRCASGKEVLLNQHTCEACLLANTGRPWTLTWDEEGSVQLVNCHGVKEAASRLLKVHVRVAACGALAVQRDGQAAILLEDA